MGKQQCLSPEAIFANRSINRQAMTFSEQCLTDSLFPPSLSLLCAFLYLSHSKMYCLEGGEEESQEDSGCPFDESHPPLTPTLPSLGVRTAGTILRAPGGRPHRPRGEEEAGVWPPTTEWLLVRDRAGV